MSNLTADRCLGVMLGLACGDALGAQIEFKARDTYPVQKNFTGRGPHRLKPGQWTDDTAMALILAEHLMDDPHVTYTANLADRWIDWMVDGKGSCTGRCFDIGIQTRSSLAHWGAHGFAPRMDDGQRGNGALMRVAPVAIRNLYNPTRANMAAVRQSGITHPRACAELSGLFATVLREAILSRTPEAAIKTIKNAMHVPPGRQRNRVKSTGYDVDTFQAAIWAVLGAKDAEDAIIRAVNLGDDADTVGAVTGALAGAIWGASSLPSRWLDKLAWRERLSDAADVLLTKATTENSDVGNRNFIA